MAIPPRPDYTRPETENETRPETATMRSGGNWLIYIAIGLIALLVLVFLLGGFNNRSTTMGNNPDLLQVPAGAPAVEPAGAPAANDDPGLNRTDDSTDPVIEIEGDAEVEVLDDT